MCFSLPIQTLLFLYLTSPPTHTLLQPWKSIYAPRSLREEEKGIVSKEKNKNGLNPNALPQGLVSVMTSFLWWAGCPPKWVFALAWDWPRTAFPNLPSSKWYHVTCWHPYNVSENDMYHFRARAFEKWMCFFVCLFSSFHWPEADDKVTRWKETESLKTTDHSHWMVRWMRNKLLLS